MYVKVIPMKKLLLITSLLLAAVVANATSKYPVNVISTKDNEVYFKVSKELVGASLEIYNEAGKLLKSAKINDRRVLIDFYFEPQGMYHIRIVTEIKSEEFQYAKNDPAAYSALPDDKLISVIQGLDIF
jgi:hypothetical protein